MTCWTRRWRSTTRSQRNPGRPAGLRPGQVHAHLGRDLRSGRGPDGGAPWVSSSRPSNGWPCCSEPWRVDPGLRLDRGGPSGPRPARRPGRDPEGGGRGCEPDLPPMTALWADHARPSPRSRCVRRSRGHVLHVRPGAERARICPACLKVLAAEARRGPARAYASPAGHTPDPDRG